MRTTRDNVEGAAGILARELGYARAFVTAGSVSNGQSWRAFLTDADTYAGVFSDPGSETITLRFSARESWDMLTAMIDGARRANARRGEG